jgi:hypothetical protein
VSWWDLGVALGGVALLTAALLQLSSGGAIASASVRAVLIGLAAGLGDGMSDTMNRLLGAWLAPGEGWIPPASIGIAAAALLFAFGFQGFVTAQNGLKL